MCAMLAGRPHEINEAARNVGDILFILDEKIQAQNVTASNGLISLPRWS